MRRTKRAFFGLLLASPVVIVAAAMGCSNGGNGGGSGGAPSTGGATTDTGGVANSGGAPAGTGGAESSGGAGTGGTPTGDGGTASGGGDPGTGGGDPGTGGSSGGGGVVPGTAGFDCTPPTGSVPALQAAPVGNGWEGAMLVTYEPNTTDDRLFVLEVTGVIKIVENGAVLPSPFLDFSSKVGVATSPGGGGDERGALGFAFHPQYAETGLFYVHYSDVNGTTGDSILEEYKVSADRNVADAASARLVKKVTQPSHGGQLRNHKGGAINFGADGFLYWGLGDGGGSGDPMGNGQSMNTLLGKILRIDPVQSGGDAYTSPAGNMTGGEPEIWDIGLRNPFRFTFDGCTGDLYIGDVGQNAREEIDVEKAGEGGKNYGWNITEGLGCYSPMSGCDRSGKVDPVLDYPRSDGTSVTGGAVYRGAAIPALRGTYIYGDYGLSKIWSIVYDRNAGTASAPVALTQELNNVTKVVGITNGPDGEIYFSSIDNGVFKLEAAE